MLASGGDSEPCLFVVSYISRGAAAGSSFVAALEAELVPATAQDLVASLLLQNAFAASSALSDLGQRFFRRAFFRVQPFFFFGRVFG